FAADYRIVAMDCAGHGESGKDRKQWTIASLAEDVEAVVKDLGLKRVILVGHSMGGPIALATAKRMPGKVVGIVAVDSLHNVEFKWPEEMSKKFLAAFESDFKGTMREGISGMMPEKADAELQKWILDKALAQDEKMAVGLMRELTRVDSKTLLKEAKVPVRAINAAGGFKFGMKTSVEANKKYADFGAVIMEGVGHFPMLERPDEFNKKLREVLKQFAAKR